MIGKCEICGKIKDVQMRYWSYPVRRNVVTCFNCHKDHRENVHKQVKQIEDYGFEL